MSIVVDQANGAKILYREGLITITEAINTIRDLAKEKFGTDAMCQEEIAKILMSRSREFTKLTD